jgi:hypothetical protein
VTKANPEKTLLDFKTNFGSIVTKTDPQAVISLLESVILVEGSSAEAILYLENLLPEEFQRCSVLVRTKKP